MEEAGSMLGQCVPSLATVLAVALVITGTPAPVAADAPFTANVRINPDLGLEEAYWPDVVEDSAGTLFAIWSDNRSGRFDETDIYVAKSFDNGATWSDPNVRVNRESVAMRQAAPRLAVDSIGVLYAAWEQDDPSSDHNIYFARSTDGGATWTDPNVRVTTDTTRAMQIALVAGPGNRVYLAWTDRRNGNDDIYFAASTDGGATWTNPNLRINTDLGTGVQAGPALAIDESGALCLAWFDNRNGDYDIYFARSPDGGATWTDPNVKVNRDMGSAWQSNVGLAASEGGTLYAAWRDNRSGNPDIYFANSTDGGTTWAPDVRIDGDAGTSEQTGPRLAVNPVTGTVYAAWEDRRNGDVDVYFASSSDGGATWLRPDLRVNDDAESADQWLPRIFASPSGRGVRAVWNDDRDGSADVFLASLMTTEPPGDDRILLWMWLAVPALLVAAVFAAVWIRRRKRRKGSVAPDPASSTR